MERKWSQKSQSDPAGLPDRPFEDWVQLLPEPPGDPAERPKLPHMDMTRDVLYNKGAGPVGLWVVLVNGSCGDPLWVEQHRSEMACVAAIVVEMPVPLGSGTAQASPGKQPQPAAEMARENLVPDPRAASPHGLGQGRGQTHDHGWVTCGRRDGAYGKDA